MNQGKKTVVNDNLERANEKTDPIDEAGCL